VIMAIVHMDLWSRWTKNHHGPLLSQLYFIYQHFMPKCLTHPSFLSDTYKFKFMLNDLEPTFCISRNWFARWNEEWGPHNHYLYQLTNHLYIHRRFLKFQPIRNKNFPRLSCFWPYEDEMKIFVENIKNIILQNLVNDDDGQWMMDKW
jgi:hypothetical protein